MSDNVTKFRSVLIATTATAAVLSLAACGSGSSGGNGTAGANNGGSGNGAKVAAVIKGLDNPFFQAMEQGIKDGASATHSTVSIQAAADITDTTGQADKLSALTGQNYSCYVVNPISGTNLVQALAPVSVKGTPIVNIDNPIDKKAANAANIKPATYIGTDNTKAGGKAAAFVLQNVPAGSQVAIIGGISGDVTSGARVTGFKDGIGNKLTVVGEAAADWQRDVALTKATDIIAANPDVRAFFVANDDMGLGVVKAVQNAGKTGQVSVVSVDGNKDALQSVLDGGLSATVAQYPYEIGELGLDACVVAVDKKKLPANIESPTALVTKDNAQQALGAFPKPFEKFQNPLETLLTK